MKMPFSYASLHEHKPIYAIVETIVLSAIAIGLCYLFHRQDMLFSQGPFPWPLLASTLIALLYGFGYGILSLVIYLVAAYILTQFPVFNLHSQLYFVGMALVTLLCGQFGSYWNRRLARIERLNHYIQEHLENVSKAYYVTRLSYERIEHSFTTRQVTMRNTLNQLEQILIKDGAELTPNTAKRFLEFLSQYASFNVAGLFLCKDNAIEETPTAHVGEAFTLNKQNTLVKQCLSESIVHYVSINKDTIDTDNDYLVAAPMISSNKKWRGLLVIKDIDFWALNTETLQTLSLLLSYFSDELISVNRSIALLKAFPTCRPIFAKELYKLTHLQNHFEVVSSLVVIEIKKSAESDFYVESIAQLQRGLDITWIEPGKAVDRILTLMPLCDSQAALNYITRIKRTIKETDGIDTEDVGITFHYHGLENADPITLLEEIFSGAGHA